MPTQQQAVAATLMQLADTLASDFDLHDYLGVLLERSSAVLDATAGGVMLTDASGQLELMASTGEAVRLTELFALQRQEGPCIESHHGGAAVIEEDLAGSSRWAQFTPAAVEAGYRSAFAFPMRVRDEPVGALGLFRTTPGPVEEELVSAAQSFAHMAAIGILHERAVRDARELAGHLQTALNSRVVIEQAKGVIAEHAGCDIRRAFDVLRWYARSSRRKLHAVAAAVVDGHLDIDEFTSPPTR